MEPFTRLIWKNSENRKNWINKIHKASQVYHATELATFEMGLRKAISYHIHPENLEKQLEMLAKGGSVFLPIRRSKIYSGFSHRHIDPQPGDPYFVYGVLAKTLEDAELFRKCSAGQKVDHGSIGQLLGYPECCIRFFEKVWGPVIDPIFEAYGSESHVHPYCNQALRYFGLRITPHLCCSSDCKATIEWGRQWFSVMEGLDKEAAGWLRELLSLPFTWNCLNGAAIVDTDLFRGVTNSNVSKKEVIVKNKGWSKLI